MDTTFSALFATSQTLFCCGAHSPPGIMSMRGSDSKAVFTL